MPSRIWLGLLLPALLFAQSPVDATIAAAHSAGGDTLDAFGVHGIGGTVGAILTGVFPTNAVNDGLKDAAGKVLPLGWVDGNWWQVPNQLAGVAIAWVLAGVPATPEQELEGLDLGMHGEEGYNFES